MAFSDAVPDPNVEFGLDYWAQQSADYDGVLGGFGSGSLPRVDALTSRQLLQHLMPELCTVPSAVRPLETSAGPKTRTRALDVGAGVGRVTSDVLLPLFDDVVLVEPVDQFVREAVARGKQSEQSGEPSDQIATREAEGYRMRWKGIRENERSVTFVKSTLQSFDPAVIDEASILDCVGWKPEQQPMDNSASADARTQSGFDVIWCQWCLGHLSDTELVEFLHRSAKALRDRPPNLSPSLIVVKENLCRDFGEEEHEARGASGETGPRTVFDEQDSSLTRSDLAWKALFERAQLKLLHEEVQRGFPEGLYAVKMYALRPLSG